MNRNQIYIFFNGAAVAVAYFMLSLSIWLAPVDLSTKGYWGMGVLLLTLSLVNFVKYRFDDRLREDRLQRYESPSAFPYEYSNISPCAQSALCLRFCSCIHCPYLLLSRLCDVPVRFEEAADV